MDKTLYTICVVEQPKSEPANTNAQRIELVFFIDSQLINILRKDKEFSGKMGQEIKTRNELIRSK